MASARCRTQSKLLRAEARTLAFILFATVRGLTSRVYCHGDELFAAHPEMPGHLHVALRMAFYCVFGVCCLDIGLHSKSVVLGRLEKLPRHAGLHRRRYSWLSSAFPISA